MLTLFFYFHSTQSEERKKIDELIESGKEEGMKVSKATTWLHCGDDLATQHMAETIPKAALTTHGHWE